MLLSDQASRSVIFCDDLSFDAADASYKSLKAVLEGGIEGRPGNVLFYATSNRRHLMPRDMIENERSTAINPSEAVEEKVSLSDRFGLWLGFHNCDQETFFAIIDGYCRSFGLDLPPEDVHAQAIEWSVTRGARSGRVAWQFIQDLARPAWARTIDHFGLSASRPDTSSGRPALRPCGSRNGVAASAHCRCVPTRAMILPRFTLSPFCTSSDWLCA